MSRRAGFTLAEMTVVIGTIAVLAAILFPAFARARERARTCSCEANLFNTALALRIYASDYDGRLPLGPAGPEVLADLGLIDGWTLLCPTAINQVSFPGSAQPPVRPSAGMGAPPGMPAPPGGPPSPTPGGSPPAGMAAPPAPGGAGAPMPGPPPALPPGATPAAPEAGDSEPAYVYQPGLSFARPTHELLMADARARHHGRANVLFADGSLHSLPEAQWSALLSPELARISGWAAEGEDQPRAPGAPGKGGGGDE